MKDKKDEEQVPVMLDYRCKRCGAPFGREAMIQCTIELSEQNEKFHHCEDGGIGIGELVGFHEVRSSGVPYHGRCLSDRLGI